MSSTLISNIRSFKVAVKIINKEKARKDPYVYKNLRREGRLLQRGHHKHVISIYDTLGKTPMKALN